MDFIPHRYVGNEPTGFAMRLNTQNWGIGFAVQRFPHSKWLMRIYLGPWQLVFRPWPIGRAVR